MSRTRAITSDELRRLLRRLDDPARLAVRIAADTGLRISDILALRPGDLAERMTVTERKTGKQRTVCVCGLIRLRPQKHTADTAANILSTATVARFTGKSAQPLKNLDCRISACTAYANITRTSFTLRTA